ncbi:MAG: glycosyltransferase [Chlorobi bacterium]|nr:glycosyltransferase [Chlorobiota bacterium]
MISVCIPVYNSRIDDLIKALYYQKTVLKFTVEIVVIDDASESEYKEHNRTLARYIDNYVELKENVGRSRIRNLFLKYAKKTNLLFIDCDSVIQDSGFLKNYVSAVKEFPGKVIVGGSTYQAKRPGKEKILRWKYGITSESKPAVERNKSRYVSFITKNVLIPASVLHEIPFEESLTGYGHEDTLMGYRLKKAGVKIVHIDNYVLNADLDTNEEFLKKSREAVVSLFLALDVVNGDKDFIDDVKLLRWVRKLYQIKLQKIVNAVLNIIMPFILFFLKNNYPSVFLLNLYKLNTALKECKSREACRYFNI